MLACLSRQADMASGGRERKRGGAAGRRVVGSSRQSAVARAPDAPEGASRSGWWAACVIAVAGILTYWNSLSGPLIFDDQLSILDNAPIREWWHLWPILTPAGETPVSGRPLVNLSFAFNYALGGLDVTGYHALNIAIHILCALLLFGVVRRTLALPSLRQLFGASSVGLAFATALIWLLHPLNSEAVDYLTERSESMMAMFYLLTLYASIRATDSRRGARWQAIAVAACASGMACKESMVTAPVIVILYDRIFLFDSMKQAFVSRWRLYAGLAATWLMLAALMWSNPRGLSAGFSGSVSSWTYLLNQPAIITAYLRRAVWPRSLVLFYGWPLRLDLKQVLPYAALIGLLLVITLVALAVRPKLGFLGAWFFVTLAPASSIVPIALEVGAERRMYLPLIAIVVLAVVGAYWLGRLVLHRTGGDQLPTARPFTSYVAIVSLAAVSLALAATTFARNREYGSAVELARTMVERWPTSANHHILGSYLAAAGDREEAERQLRAAVPGAPRARYDLGALLFEEGRMDESVEQLKQLVEVWLSPPADHAPWEPPTSLDVLRARTIMGEVFARRQQWTDSVEQFQMVLAMDPANSDVHRRLARSLAALGRVDEAIVHDRAYLEKFPTDAGALVDLGVLLARTGRIDDAVATFRRAVEAAPSDADAHYMLGSVLEEQGNRSAARAEFEEALRLNPADADAREGLSRTSK
jgi:protein O-mannosyl-transferase